MVGTSATVSPLAADARHRRAASAAARITVRLRRAIFMAGFWSFVTWFKLIVNPIENHVLSLTASGADPMTWPVEGSAMSVESSVRPRSAYVRRARQREGRLGQIHHRDACRGRAAEGRASASRPSTSTRRQKSFTHYIENRRGLGASTPALDLEVPAHYCIARAEGALVDENEAAEFGGFAAAIDAVEHTHDFVVIDTPGNDSYLMRLAHSMADTLITPLNDSFVDFDVLGTVDPATFAVTGTSHYAEMVRDARRQRRIVDQATIDWIVVRNRLSHARLAQQAAGRRGAAASSRCGSASAPSTASPSAWSSASSFRAG